MLQVTEKQGRNAEFPVLLHWHFRSTIHRLTSTMEGAGSSEHFYPKKTGMRILPSGWVCQVNDKVAVSRLSCEVSQNEGLLATAMFTCSTACVF
jgi:hypothetical protein